MKTSIIEVSDMLSVFTVDEVEKRFGDVSGVESATVNYAAKNATVRYDETLLEVADIKILVHQRGQQSAGESKSGNDSPSKSEHLSEAKPAHKHAEAPTPDTVPGSASQPGAAAPVDAQGTKSPPGAPPLPGADAPGA